MRLFQVTEPHIQFDDTGRFAGYPSGMIYELTDDSMRVPLAVDAESGVSLYIPVVQDEKLKQVAQLARATENKLYYADIRRENDLHLVRHNDVLPQLEAVVHIATATSDRGTLRLTANTHEEVTTTVWTRSRGLQPEVQRNYGKFPPPGVELLNPNHVVIDERGVCRWHPDLKVMGGTPPIVVKMLKNASFRIWRTGDIDGACPEFIVTWDGSRLRTVVPRNILDRRRR